jgi:hypothetical protein
MSQFSGRITRADAASMKIDEVLSNLPPSEIPRWERAYEQLEEAWRIAWPYVERFECQELTDNLKQVRLNRDSALVWCIADQANEGICPLALTQWLVERHNELVQVVSASAASGQRQNERAAARKVSSRLLGQHDIVCYDKEELMRFLKNRCVTYGVGGKLNFDFTQLEQHLLRELARPEITMELRAFQWLGEAHTAVNELRTVIKQRDLTPEIAERLRAELASTSLAHACLQKVQMSTSFVLKSGGALSTENAGEMLLSEYLSTVLSESEESLPSKTARAEVHLCHVDAFAKLLKQLINKDPMDAVDPKYRVPLPEKLEQQLTSVRDMLPETLTELMGIFAETQLEKTFLGAEVRLIDTLNAVMSEDSDMSQEHIERIQRHFPEGLQMQHWGAVYLMLRERRRSNNPEA